MSRQRWKRTCRAGVVAALLLAGTAERPLLGQPATPRIDRGEELRLGLRDAIERALQNNLDIRVERYSIDVSRIRLMGARGYYDPIVGMSLGANSSKTPVTSLLQGGGTASETVTGQTFGPRFSQNLPTGGSVNASVMTLRNDTNNSFSFVNPLIGSQLTLGFTQPLWRGLMRDPARRQLRILNLDARITEAQFRQAVSEVAQRVEEQYWNLVFAEDAYRARQESRSLADKQREQIVQKVQAGLLTPVALTSARAEVAFRDQEMIAAEVQIVQAEIGLKRLLAGDPAAEIWTRHLVTTDRPQLKDPPATLNEALQSAIRNRPELQRLALQLKQNQVDLDYLKWETKPSVNLNGTIGSVGRAGTVYRTLYDPLDGTAIGREVDTTQPNGGLTKAWNQVFAWNYPNWSIGVEVTVPVFNHTAKAQLAEAEVNRRRLETSVKQQEQTIMAEVANTYQSVELQRRAVDVARLARELSEEQLNGETARFNAGFTTNFEVLRYQRDLGDARVRELRAVIDYQIAVAALRKAMDVIVDDHDLVLAKSPR